MTTPENFYVGLKPFGDTKVNTEREKIVKRP
jgi:hypothetical protein